MALFACAKEAPLTEEEKGCMLSDLEAKCVIEIDSLYGHPFNAADPLIDENGALDSLINYLGEATVVGLGEATHGSAEFFKMKDKVFRALVNDKDFRAIIFEIPWGNCLAVNDFVVNNINTAEKALDQTWYWVYNTQETVDLALWMNEENKSRLPEEKLFFVGCDPQGPNFEIEKNVLLNYLEEYGAGVVDTVRSRYSWLPRVESLRDYHKLPIERININKENVSWVYDFIEDLREPLVIQSGKFKYEVALMAAHVIKHRELMFRIQSFGQTRDSLMAIYTQWWQKILPHSSKVGVWAHNLHVMDNPNSGGQWMGSYLRKFYGGNYKNVAFSFAKGGLNAFLTNGRGEFLSVVEEQFVIDDVCRSSNYLFEQAAADQFYIIFDELQWPSAMSTYVTEPHDFFQMGAGFNNRFMHNYTSSMYLNRYWDAVIHFDYVSATELQ